MNQTEVDVRDSNGPKSRTTHYINLKNLQASQKYYFKIASQDQLFGDRDKPFEQLTVAVSEETPKVPILTFGKIKKKNGKIPKEAILYFRLPNSTTLSTYIGDDGNWLITVTNARKDDLFSYADVKDGDSATVWAEGGLDGNLSNTQININSKKALEDLVLEKLINFTEESENNSLRDFNEDGLINALDYATMIKRILKL